MFSPLQFTTIIGQQTFISVAILSISEMILIIITLAHCISLPIADTADMPIIGINTDINISVPLGIMARLFHICTGRGLAIVRIS